MVARSPLPQPGSGARVQPRLAAASGARMVLRMQLLEVLARNKGVDLGGRQRSVTQQHLQRETVGAVVEQVGGEAVTQAVRATLVRGGAGGGCRTEDHTSALRSAMRTS